VADGTKGRAGRPHISDTALFSNRGEMWHRGDGAQGKGTAKAGSPDSVSYLGRVGRKMCWRRAYGTVAACHRCFREAWRVVLLLAANCREEIGLTNGRPSSLKV
jgi:hypothetical protein